MIAFEYYKGYGIEYLSMIRRASVQFNGLEVNFFTGSYAVEDAKKWIDNKSK